MYLGQCVRDNIRVLLMENCDFILLQRRLKPLIPVKSTVDALLPAQLWQSAQYKGNSFGNHTEDNYMNEN